MPPRPKKQAPAGRTAEMTPRERMLKAFAFDHPDKIPVVYHPSTAGMYVHGQKMIDLYNAYPSDSPNTFTEVPRPAAGTVGTDGAYREVKRDEWGVVWEYLIFGVQGHPRSYPFPDWAAARDYAFPPVPEPDAAWIGRARERFCVFTGWNNLLERLHALRPMDEVLVDIYLQNPDFMAFLDRLVAYRVATIERELAAGADVIMCCDDWGTQTAPIISPELFRDVFKPRYAALFAPIKAAGRKVFFHSCGYLGPIFDELVDLGIDGLWPQIGLFEADPRYGRICRERRVTLYLHFDRQRLVPCGTPDEIRATVRRYADLYHAQGGGGIFYIEIENDAPFANVEALVRAVHEYR